VPAAPNSTPASQILPRLPAFMSEFVIEQWLSWFARKAACVPSALGIETRKEKAA
jgi:hypothetical protein